MQIRQIGLPDGLSRIWIIAGYDTVGEQEQIAVTEESPSVESPSLYPDIPREDPQRFLRLDRDIYVSLLPAHVYGRIYLCPVEAVLVPP